MAPSTFAKVTTALGEDALMLASMSGEESLGRPFVYELELLSEDRNVDFKAVINQPATVHLELQDKSLRHINGIVTRFGCVGESGRYIAYRATLHPWIWLLSRSMDCRIFDDITIPDLIKTVFRDHGFSDFDFQLTREYRTWEYLVQYRETALDFVQRLMEQEGIYYFFKQEDGKHTLVATDSHSAQDTPSGYESIPYHQPYVGSRPEHDHIDGWRVTQEVQTAAVALNDYDFRKPKAELLASNHAQFEPDRFELYDYPGEYAEVGDGERYVRLWKEQVDSRYELVEGKGNTRGLVLGGQFSLTDFPREDQQRKYVVTAMSCRVDVGAFETSRAERDPTYRCTFRALDTKVPFRPAHETPKPEIRGPQTAVVVGYAKDDEIHTDQYGRVKVRFPWVRANEHEKVSCWVRVAQLWAGTRWGGIHIPRVGQEVIVEFLEADPDRPIITGRVYNANNMPPYDLPANKTQSGIKSRSSKGARAENFNELRFEDLKGAEQLYMQAERNMDTLVKNDQTLHVVVNRTKTIGKNEDTTVGENRTEQVVKDETISIGGDRAEVVEGTETISIAGKRTESVGKDESLLVTGSRDESIGGSDTLKVTKDIVIDAGSSITIKTGAASITMKSNGDILINGQNVRVKGSGMIDAKATGAISLRGRTVGSN
jgi:type VI secretion system secreted protein VgrG